VTTEHTRKAFFAKLGGLIVAAGIMPKLFARAGSNSATPATIQLRPERRAVVRQEGSL